VLVGTNKRVELTTPFKSSSTEDFTLIFSRSDSDGNPHRAAGTNRAIAAHINTLFCFR